MFRRINICRANHTQQDTRNETMITIRRTNHTQQNKRIETRGQVEGTAGVRDRTAIPGLCFVGFIGQSLACPHDTDLRF